jgi:hypothetical protein
MSEATIHSERWFGDALRAAWNETKLYLRTARSALLHPGKFAAAWSRNEAVGMNPLGFFASSLAAFALIGDIEQLGHHDDGQTHTLWDAVGPVIGPYVTYGMLAFFCFGILRLARQRAPLWALTGLLLFIAGPIEIIANLWVGVVSRALSAHKHAGDVVGSVGTGLCFLWFCVALVIAFSALYRLRRIWLGLLFFVSLTLSGLVFGNLLPPGPWGLYFALPIHFVRNADDTRTLTVSFNVNLQQ